MPRPKPLQGLKIASVWQVGDPRQTPDNYAVEMADGTLTVDQGTKIDWAKVKRWLKLPPFPEV